MDQTKAFTLSDGRGVLLHKLTQADFDALCKWAKQTYIGDVSSAVEGMANDERLLFIQEALAIATGPNFMMGRGLEILFGTPIGITRVIYQLIVKPSFSFVEFYTLLFPDSLYLRTGLEVYIKGFEVLNAMCRTVYGANIDGVFWSTEMSPPPEEPKPETTENTSETETTENTSETENSETESISDSAAGVSEPPTEVTENTEAPSDNEDSPSSSDS